MKAKDIKGLLPDLLDTEEKHLSHFEEYKRVGFNACIYAIGEKELSVLEIVSKALEMGLLKIKLCDTQGCKQGEMFDYDKRTYYNCPTCHGKGWVLNERS